MRVLAAWALVRDSMLMQRILNTLTSPWWCVGSQHRKPRAGMLPHGQKSGCDSSAGCTQHLQQRSKRSVAVLRANVTLRKELEGRMRKCTSKRRR